MTTDTELIKMIKNLGIKNFRGCFMRNELLTEPKEIECGILNFQSNIEGNGIHWICWFKNKEMKIFFDSFGTNPPDELVK